jgi:hypothetical protein
LALLENGEEKKRNIQASDQGAKVYESQWYMQTKKQKAAAGTDRHACEHMTSTETGRPREIPPAVTLDSVSNVPDETWTIGCQADPMRVRIPLAVLPSAPMASTVAPAVSGRL